MSKILNVWGFFLAFTSIVNSARILGIFHVPAYSHFQIGDRILTELAARGHEVTVITPFEQKAPVKNLKHVVLNGFHEIGEDLKKNLLADSGMGTLSKLLFFDTLGKRLTEATLKHTNVQKLLNSGEKFDLVIQENLANEAFSGFAAHYRVPNIIVNSQGASRRTKPQMGNPHNPAYSPDVYLFYSQDMNLVQRTLNTLLYVSTELVQHLYMLPNQNKLVEKYFPNGPGLADMYYNTSLMLLNSHVSTANPLPLVPNMIEIGGFHVQPPKPLPKDLQDYLDSAKEGVVFFSMGSNLQSKDLPQEKLDAILKVLGKLKQKVLWKWEADKLPGQPTNVKIEKWLPQQDILAHPNVKLFITHGGLLSTIEAIYHGVPVLAVPVFGDQELNAVNAEIAGYGIGVPFKDLNEASLGSAVTKLLNNPKYTENVKQRSKIMHDQPIKPLDKAVYWIEYVLRHKGAPHLRTAALNLEWYQLLLLDVVAVLAVCATVVVWVLWKVLRLLYSRSRSKKRAHKNTKSS